MKVQQKKFPRFKIQRKLITELPGLGKAGALEKRPYPPGQHGAKRIKYSDYRLQLEEKQKIRFHYNLREEQLKRFVRLAKKKQANWLSELISILESRLENVVFRAGFARSQMSSAQMISHGQVLVNGKKVNLRSYIVKINDIVELTNRGINNQIYQKAKQSPRLDLPDWLEKIESENQVKVILKETPKITTVPFPLEESLVISYYSKL